MKQVADESPRMPHLPASLRTIVRAALLGLAVGTVILGVGGRAVMRVAALLAGHPGGFSIGGSLEVVATGALFGLVGGALLPAVPTRLRWARPPLHAAALFVIIALTSAAARSAAAGLPNPARVSVLVLFYALIVVYSSLLDFLYRRR